MKYTIKTGYNTIHQKEFYWEDPKTGYRISVVKFQDCLLSDEDLKQTLLEKIEEYLHA